MADVLSIVKCIAEVVLVIHNGVGEVKYFQKRSERLVENVELISPTITALQLKLEGAGANDRASGDGGRCATADGGSSLTKSLLALQKCFEQIQKFIKKLSDQRLVSQLFRKSSITRKFDGFESQLVQLKQNLMLDIQARFGEHFDDNVDSMCAVISNQFNMQKCQGEAIADLAGDMEYLKTKVGQEEERSKQLAIMQDQIAVLQMQQGQEEERSKQLAIMQDQIAVLQMQQTFQPTAQAWEGNLCIDFGDFSDVTLLDEGTYGPIYKARHRVEQKQMLVIKSYMCNAVFAIKELKEQMELWKGLRFSRFIVQLYGYTMYQEGNQERMCFVQEYMHLGMLRSVLLDHKKHPLSWAVRVSLARDCASGLDAIHRGQKKPMLHRAVTSTRFLVNRHYEAKISDNGYVKTQSKISKSKNSRKGNLEQEELNYHCPEDSQIVFKPTVQSEVYQLGVIFYEIASRKKPFQSFEEDGEGLSRLDKYNMTIAGEMEQPPPDTPARFRDLIASCRSRSPSDRPSTAEIISELNDLEEEV